MTKVNKYLLITILCIFLASTSFAEKYRGATTPEPPANGNIKGFAAACQLGKTVTEISLNNIRTFIFMDGILWTDIGGSNAGYEVPKGSGKTSIYAGGIWIGGTDVNGQLKLTAVKFKETSNPARNYWPGPLIMSGEQRGTTDVEVCYQYDKHYQITRYQVQAFREWYNTPADQRDVEFKGYSIPQIILDWPAHADAAAGYDFYLAPYWDNNDDGLYNAGDGDYPFYDLDGILPCGTTRELRRPRLYGDGTAWWVYNDRGNIHSNPNGEAIGMEIRAQAFQFSTNDAMNDMSFYNYALINRSTYTLVDTYFGVYCDADLGYAFDDYTGCHVTKGIGYIYNGDAVDGTGEAFAYGANPPSVGIDFFEGPYQDPNGKDDCTSYDAQDNLICNDCILNGNINGLNFGDNIVDNERWGMRRYVYYNNSSGNQGDPGSAPEFYQYLRGYWKDNVRMRYGGNGHPSSGGTGPVADFMFPRETDPCGWGQGGIPQPIWTEETAGNKPDDRRLLQSSGPFILEPGAVNDITIGVVWARSYDGGLLASVDKMLQSDEKAQKLFENCFKIVDGPDAPELTIVEQDQKLIFHIWNKVSSNNFMEKYRQRDPFIVCPATSPTCDADYRFEGYQIWQLKTASTSVTDATEHNTQLARVIYQCDVRNGVGRLVNFNWNADIEANVPVIEVVGKDQGIEHTFVQEEDIFAEGVRTLVNFKKYYYVAVAYAYNNFLKYDQNDPTSFEGQRFPYLAGRKGAGGPIKVYEAIPHKIEPEKEGTVIQGTFGDAPPIVQIEGHGTGMNVVEISKASHDEIMKGSPWKVRTVTYQAGKGPISVKVVDPMSVVPDTYTVKFDSVNFYNNPSGVVNGKVLEAKWYIYNTKHDTVFSESVVSNNYDQLILQWGIAVNISQADIPFQYGAINNGLLDYGIEYQNPGAVWLSFIPDEDRSGPRNWVKSGYNDADNSDKNSVYEKVLEGTWAPFQLTSGSVHGPGYDKASNSISSTKRRLSSIDLYITADRTKWSRSPVLETTDDPLLSINGAQKFDLRTGLSIDKKGKAGIAGSGASTNENDPNYISETGMGWFPGYAIDVETGMRLNIVYGESSFLTGDNGADMAWNPSTREGSKLYYANNRDNPGYTDVYFGGKHYIYIMGQNRTKAGTADVNRFPSYDAGKFYMEKMADTKNSSRKQQLLVNAMWSAIPIADSRFMKPEDVATDVYGFMKQNNDIKIRLRVVGQYCVGVYDNGVRDSVNRNWPMYQFNTDSIATKRGDLPTAQEALKLIRVVPNPYYGNSAYELTQLDNLVKITNLPKTCTVSIYSINGNLVRRFTKDAEVTYLDWDLKNQYGIPIASGAYIVHINAPGIGERIVKFFGALRPQDLNSL